MRSEDSRSLFVKTLRGADLQQVTALVSVLRQVVDGHAVVLSESRGDPMLSTRWAHGASRSRLPGCDRHTYTLNVL